MAIFKKQAESKAERMAKVVASPKLSPEVHGPVKPAPVAKAEDQKTVGSGDQKPKAEDQKTSKKKKDGDMVQKWRLQKQTPFKAEQVITVLSKTNPKSKGAAHRFDLYKSGMTVGEYTTACIESKMNTKKGAQDDVCWDVVHGFISIK